ncbi:MAG: cyclic nucleotide-binding domain-containing protein [Anaerolineales bacterium]|nr:cyclic nucleotide-binding domain-containing protein [Anaerolineales bacterium]
MPGPKLLAFLHRIHFLRHLDQEDLQDIIQSLEKETYFNGEIITRQGRPATALYFIFNGQVDLIERGPEGETELIATLGKGDTFGEVELLYGETWSLTQRAAKDTTLFRWPLEELMSFMKRHPSSLDGLKFAAKSRRLSYQLNFDWLSEGEVIYGLARRHSFVLIRWLILPLLLFLAGLFLASWAMSSQQSFAGLASALLMIVAIMLSIWRLIDFRNDYYILTNRRAIWQEKVVGIYESRHVTPLYWVLSVSVSTGMLGRLLGYGDVIIRTYTGKLTFRDVGSPDSMAAIVEEHWRRRREQRQVDDRDEMLRSLEERLAEGDEEELTEEYETFEDDYFDEFEEAPPSEIGLSRWSLRMRIESEGVITYRKHWAVLLRQLMLPTIGFFLLVSFLGLRIGGNFEGITAENMTLIFALTCIPLLLWWLYRFVDWANDIYQITPTQIIDINKKPLAREVRKIAPLENILGTEVDRKGISGLLLNYGSVIANVGTAQFIFHGVFDPTGVQQDIIYAQDALLERKSEEARRQRREEVVEWLSAYHEEIASKEQPDESE